MQRSSNTTARNIIIGSVIVILLISVLYYLKRVEVGHLKRNIDSLQAQRSEHDDDLNSKLTDYLQKLEDMTHQLGDINSRLQECEDNKANVMTEVQKCKGVHTECTTAKEKLETDMGALRKELEDIKAKHSSVNSQLSSHQDAAQNAKQALADAERELEQCESEKDKCTNSKNDLVTQLQDCQQRDAQCRSREHAGGYHSFQKSEGQRLGGLSHNAGGISHNAGGISHNAGGISHNVVSAGDRERRRDHFVATKADVLDALLSNQKDAKQPHKEVDSQAQGEKDADPDPLNANEEDDRADGGVDDALAALEQAEGGAKNDHAPQDTAQKDGIVDSKENEEKAEKAQELEAVKELENKAGGGDVEGAVP